MTSTLAAGPERLAQLRDANAQRRRAGRRLALAPQLVHQPVRRDDLPGVQEQDRQQLPLARARQRHGRRRARPRAARGAELHSRYLAVDPSHAADPMASARIPQPETEGEDTELEHAGPHGRLRRAVTYRRRRHGAPPRPAAPRRARPARLRPLRPAAAGVPSQQGHSHDYEDMGMVDAIAGLIDAGRVKLYCVDTIDGQTWHDDSLPLEERAPPPRRLRGVDPRHRRAVHQRRLRRRAGHRRDRAQLRRLPRRELRAQARATCSRSRSARAASTTSRPSAGASAATPSTSTTPPTTCRTCTATTWSGCAAGCRC